MSDEAPATETPAEGASQESGAWYDGLPSDLKNDPYVQKFQSAEDLVKSAISAQSLIGRKGVIVPQEGDSPEVVQKFREAIGVPQSVDAYDPSVLGDGFSDSEKDVLRQRALESGLPESSWKAFAEGLNETREAQRASLTEKAGANIEALKKEWGAAFESKIDLADRAGQEIWGDRFESLADLKLEDGTPLKMNPDFIKELAELGEKLGEGDVAVPGAGTSTSKNLMTPEEADAAYRALVGDPEKVKIMQNTAHPECRLLNEQRKRLSALRAAGN